MQKNFSLSTTGRIVGTISIPDQATSVVILSHGFASSRDSDIYKELQEMLNSAGIGTVRYNYYGHGQRFRNTGGVSEDVTLTKTVDSLREVVKYVRSEGDYGVALLGASFGGLISLIVAAEDSGIKALVLKSPVTEPISFWRNRLSDEQIVDWEREGILDYSYKHENYRLKVEFRHDLQNYDTAELAKKISCPTLIVHGEKDTIVPIEQSHDLARILNTEVRIVKGAEHNYAEPEQYAEVKRVMTEFLIEKLRK